MKAIRQHIGYILTGFSSEYLQSEIIAAFTCSQGKIALFSSLALS